MKHLLSDGRLLMASYNDINDFFEKNNISEKIIKDIMPKNLDYAIKNLDEIENIYSLNAISAIETDGPICIVFTDGNHIEVEFSGDGPLLLGYNTADFNTYPEYDGSCYTLKTLFQYCIGRKITDIIFETTGHKMLFPCYHEIDMSMDDDGIRKIKFKLDDETFLITGGMLDWFILEHCDEDGEFIQKVPYKDLLSELSEETLSQIFDEGE